MSRRQRLFLPPAIPESPVLDQFAAGEYWFVSGDFVAFATNFPLAHAALGHLCALRSADLNICVRAADKAVATRFVSQYYGGAQLQILPDKVMLLLGQMIQVDASGKACLYLLNESGNFTFQNGFEVLRIRSGLLNLAIAA
jgi:hypothetical protein